MSAPQARTAWLRELVDPWIAGTPPPLTDTVPPEALADADSRWATVRGVKLHYKEAGPTAHPDAPTVLLLHGLNGSTFSWRDIMPALAQARASPAGCRVIAFDRPPYGLSHRPLTWQGGADNNPYSNEGGARLAEGLLDELGVKRAVLVGHSAGALTAMSVVQRRPDLVAGLVFIGPALPTNERKSMSEWLQQRARWAYARALLQTDGPGLTYIRKQLLKRRAEVEAGRGSALMLGDSAQRSEVIAGYLKPMQAHDWDRGCLLSYRCFDWPRSMPYERVQQPVLFVQGEKDFLAASARKVAELFKQRPGCHTQYVELPGFGHVPMDEDPAACLQPMLPFVEQVFADASPAAAASASS